MTRIELFGWTCTVIAITGVILNNLQCRYCFLLWLLSNGLSMWIHYRTKVKSLMYRDLVFLALAVWGWVEWSK